MWRTGFRGCQVLEAAPIVGRGWRPGPGHSRAGQAGAGLGAVLSKANSAVGNEGLGRVRDPTFWAATVL